jgi:hypothetical protein
MTTQSKTKIVEPDYTEKVKGLASKYGEIIAHGMAFAIGGLIVNGMASKYSTRKESQLIASEENVLTFDKTANS